MEDLKIGDIITLQGFEKEQIRGIAGKVIFSRKVFENGFSKTNLLGDIDDLITFGWKKLTPTQSNVDKE